MEEAGERVITAEDSNYIIIGYDNYLDIEGLSAMLAYEFENDSLSSVLVTVMAGDACVMSEDEVAVILKKNWTRLMEIQEKEKGGKQTILPSVLCTYQAHM